MLSLECLPHEALVEFFHQLNQHEALALASLHSKLYHVANPKLYRNIDVYASWPLEEQDPSSSALQQTFPIS